MLSQLPLASVFPSGETARVEIPLEWPVCKTSLSSGVKVITSELKFSFVIAVGELLLLSQLIQPRRMIVKTNTW